MKKGHVEEREEELNGIKIRSLIGKDKEEEIRGRFQGGLTRRRLKALEGETKGLFMSNS